MSNDYGKVIELFLQKRINSITPRLPFPIPKSEIDNPYKLCYYYV